MKTLDEAFQVGDDPKGMIKFVRANLRELLNLPGARNAEGGEKKIRFYDWCLAREDGVQKFRVYAETKARSGEEAGFKAAGWEE